MLFFLFNIIIESTLGKGNIIQMKKIVQAIKCNKKIHYLIIIITALISAIPLIKMQVALGDDGTHHILRIMAIDKIMKIGEFPQYISPDYCTGFGYAVCLFYNPIVTYIPYIIKLFTTHYYTALKIYSLFTIIVSAFTMYKFAEGVSKRQDIALVAAMIYTLFPYKMETIYDRFAIGEFSAYMFIPIVFLGLYNVIKEDGKKNYLIPLGAIGLMLTHTITTEYTAFFCLLYVLFNFKVIKQKEIIKKFVLDVLIILGATAFFIVPIFEHKISTEYVIFTPDLICTTGEYAQEHAISVKQLFVDAESDGVSFKIGVPIIILVLLGILSYKKIDKNIKDDYVLWFFFAAISIIMCLKIFMWKLLPNFLCTLQYPWRMLEFFGFFISIVCAFNLCTFIDNFKKVDEVIKNCIFLLSIVLITTLSIPMITRYDVPEKLSNIDEKYENMILEENMKISHWGINRDYLPVKALMVQKTYLMTREDRVYVLTGSATIEDENKENLDMKFKVKNTEEGTVLELPYIFYLGYDVTIKNGEETIKLETFESDNGFVACKIPKNIEEAEVLVNYNGTTVEKVSYLISIVTVVLCIAYLINKKRVC